MLDRVWPAITFALCPVPLLMLALYSVLKEDMCTCNTLASSSPSHRLSTPKDLTKF